MAAVSHLDRCALPSCGVAFAAGARGGLCAGCKDARYCTAACQRAHWPEHKAACKGASAKAKAALRDMSAALAEARGVAASASAPPAGRPLPRDGFVVLTGEALDLALYSRFSVRDVEGECAELRRMRAKVPADMIARVEANLRRVPVSVAFRDQSNGGAWDSMKQDLKLWHCARLVLHDIPLPWITEGEGDAWAARLGGGYAEKERPGGGAGFSGAGGSDCISFGGRTIMPPAGATLRVLRDGPNTAVQAVWPSGRTVVLASAGPPGPWLDAIAAEMPPGVVVISPEERAREAAAARRQ